MGLAVVAVVAAVVLGAIDFSKKPTEKPGKGQAALRTTAPRPSFLTTDENGNLSKFDPSGVDKLNNDWRVEGKMEADEMKVNGNLNATGNITSNGNLTTTGSVTAGSITTNGNLTTTGNIISNGNLNVTGNITSVNTVKSKVVETDNIKINDKGRITIGNGYFIHDETNGGIKYYGGPLNFDNGLTLKDMIRIGSTTITEDELKKLKELTNIPLLTDALRGMGFHLKNNNVPAAGGHFCNNTKLC